MSWYNSGKFKFYKDSVRFWNSGGEPTVITTNFKVPDKILQEFVHIAKKNYSTNTKDPGHIDRRRKISAISLVNSLTPTPSTPPLLTCTHVQQFDS